MFNVIIMIFFYDSKKMIMEYSYTIMLKILHHPCQVDAWYIIEFIQTSGLTV